MLQFIAQAGLRRTIAESADMAIKGGCRWIQLRLSDMPDEEASDLVSEIIPSCRESEAFLTVEDRPGLARELSLHGVHVTKRSGISPAKLREDLGPEAIIGAEADCAEHVLALRGADVDYVTLSRDMPEAKVKEILDEVTAAGFSIPVVVEGDFAAADIKKLIEAGVSGVAMGHGIAESVDPVATTVAIIKMLEEARGNI